MGGGAMSKSGRQCGDLEALSSVEWWYDWSPNGQPYGCSSASKAKAAGEYVPMMSGLSDITICQISI